MTRHAGARPCTVSTCRRGAPPAVVLDGAYICHGCADRVARWLAEVPAVWLALGDALTPLVLDRAEIIGWGRTPPMPLVADVADARAELAGWLVSEVRMWREELPAHGWPTSPAPPDTAAWLAVHAARIRHREWADTTHDALRDLRARAAALVDLPRWRAVFRLGACPEAPHAPYSPEQGACGGSVWARVPADAHRRAVVVCDRCARTWHADEWHTLGWAMGHPLRGVRRPVPE